MTHTALKSIVFDGREAYLEITYKITTLEGVDVESDAIKFNEQAEDYTPAAIRRAAIRCFRSAVLWVEGQRDQGFEVHAWDRFFNQY
jgi:hypothetical protein